jgi:hypothetical protein
LVPLTKIVDPYQKRVVHDVQAGEQLRNHTFKTRVHAKEAKKTNCNVALQLLDKDLSLDGTQLDTALVLLPVQVLLDAPKRILDLLLAHIAPNSGSLGVLCLDGDIV